MIGVLAATLVAAGALQLYAPAGPEPAASPAAAALRPDEILAGVEQAKLSEVQAYRIGLLAGNATEDPFYGGKVALSQVEGADSGAAELVYAGYIKSGQKLLAIINGIEYAHGDQLAEGGYVVQAIDKASVLLERTDGSTGRKFTRRVPLVEDDTDKIRIRVVKRR